MDDLIHFELIPGHPDSRDGYRTADTGEWRLMIVKGLWRKEYTEVVRADPRINRLFYNPGDGVECDLAFLRDLPQIRFHSCRLANRCDVTALSDCPHLEEVSIGDQPGDPQFARMSGLRKLRLIDWTGHDGLAGAVQIEHLVWVATQLEDLTLLEGWDRLAYLSLDCGRLASLRGLAALPALREFRALGQRHLNDASELEELFGCTQLERLDLSSCGVMPAIEDVARLTQLELLGLFKRRSVPTLRPLLALQRLEFLGLGGTTVEDGDVSCMLELPALARIRLGNSDAHDMTVVDLSRRLKKRTESRRDG